MVGLKITDVKQFMAKLLAGDTFDHFLLSEAVIQTHHTFQIDGRIHQEFYSSEELEQMELNGRTLSYWKELKKYCFEIIRGKSTPLGFKFIFLLSAANVEKFLLQSELQISPQEINGLILTVKFERGSLICTTGTSQKNFTLDKSLDQAWDSMIKKFLTQYEFSFDQL